MIKPIKGKNHLVIKRDGRTEPYDRDKLYAVILWACEGSTVFADELINTVNIKIHNSIPITTLYNEVITTASNFISDLYPNWERVAKNLYELKLHKELGVLRDHYPRYEQVIAHNIQLGLYDKSLFDLLPVPLLAEAIDPTYDKLFTFGGLDLFTQKYCNKHKGLVTELPQHTYMRIAIQLMHTGSVADIIAKYRQLASHLVTEATPKMTNSAKPNPQLFSCCLARPEDSLESINVVADTLARESKFGGGLATDISAIRAKGSPIKGNNGTSSGTTPFAQALQATTGAYNQGSTRSSAMCVYYNWYHYEAPEITQLKDESGKDEDRARKMKYAIKWNKTFSTAIREDGLVYLFDPHHTQDLTFAYGNEFEELYTKYSKNTKIKKRTYSARDLAYLIAKLKIETGNNYTFFTDNANLQNIGAGVVTQSNLCMEYIPNFRTIRHISDKLITTDQTYFKRKYEGDIALCNLSSLNVVEYVKLLPEQRDEQMFLLLSSMDNAIDSSFYANPLGLKHSREHRNVGIGVSNYAYLLASEGATWDSDKARQLTHELFEDIAYRAIKASIELAKLRGKFSLCQESKWAQGIFPHELSILGAQESTLNYPLLHDWESLRKELQKYGIRNEYLLAIAPTATSAQVINATPGVDAPRKLKTIQEGTYSIPFVVPGLREHKASYQLLFDIANKDTIELAAIRQKFIDMGQSVSLAYKNPNSTYEVINDILYAEALGLKSLYYTHTPGTDDLSESGCESCQS